jgi:hypothetical protein
MKIKIKPFNDKNINIHHSYINEIKNIKTLDIKMINNIHNLNNKDLIEMIIVYNDIVKLLKNIILNP